MSDFRQGTVGRLQVVFITQLGTLVDQPTGLPTVEVVFIDPNTMQTVTALERTLLKRIDVGRYFFDWRIPFDQPLLVHQIIYRGLIGSVDTLGEDTATILGATPQCLFEPTILTKTKTILCGCS